MNQIKNENNQKGHLLFGEIPVIALIFPPIGLMMLIRYLLNKKPNERTGNG
jgi:hypothetical protein